MYLLVLILDLKQYGYPFIAYASEVLNLILSDWNAYLV